MVIKEVLQRRDTLKSYLHSLSIAYNFCQKNIGDKTMLNDLQGIYEEIDIEFKKISESLKPFEELNM